MTKHDTNKCHFYKSINLQKFVNYFMIQNLTLEKNTKVYRFINFTKIRLIILL